MDDKQKSRLYFDSHSSTFINRNGYWNYDYRMTSKILKRRNVKNLIDIYSACTGKTPQETVAEFEGKGYGEFKPAVGEAVISVLKPLQDEYARLSKDKAYLDSVIKENAEKAGYYAAKTLRKVQRKVGFPDRIR